MKRYLSIDILRAVAILLMVQVHFVENLALWEDSSDWLYGWSCWLGNWPAPLFTLLSGLSFSLWARKQESLGRRDEDTTKIAIRRGMFIFGAGLAYAVFIWLPEDVFIWDILTLIGASLVVLSVARKLPLSILLTICIAVLIISPPLRGHADYPAYWEDFAFSYDFTLRQVIYGFVVNGYFPLLPWIIFPLVGFMIGETAFRRRDGEGDSWRSLLLCGGGLMLLSVISMALGGVLPSFIARHFAGGTIFPASTAYIIGTSGLSVLCLGVLHRWIDQNERITGTGPVLLFFRRFSAFSLTVYILHHAVHIWPLWIYGVAMMGKEHPTFYWRSAMSTQLALTLSLVFIVVCYVALIFLERHRKLSFEWWMRWVCD